jgi:hypothetical protein
MIVNCFTVTLDHSNPKSFDGLYHEFGDNIPMYLQYEGGSIDHTTFLCCVCEYVPVEDMCAQYNYICGTLYRMEIDTNQYNSSYTIYPTYCRKEDGVPYKLGISM